MAGPLTIAWFSQFPVEWLPDAPDFVKELPREHPSTWQRVLLDELEVFPGLRLHVLVLSKQIPRNFQFERNGVTFHLIKTPGRLRAPSLFWVDTWLIRRKLRTIRPDAVHAWGTERGGALIARRLRWPAVVTIQGLMGWYGEVVPLHLHDRLASWLERYSLPRADVVTTESSFSVAWLRRRYPGLHVEQVEHAPAALFHQIGRQPQTEPLRFLFVGVFDYRKGADLLIAALDRLRTEMAFELVMVSRPAGALVEKLRRQTSSDLWKRIHFKPDLSPAQVAEELTRATMVIFPTRADTSPNSVKEAVVAGVPVVGSVVGGIPDYVFPGQNGLLFRPGDLAELTESIRAACRHPLFRHGRVEEEALQKTRAYLSPKTMGKRFLEIYNAARKQGSVK
jgi:glycosyltransferase involved in cell wall biosynthesis